MAPEGVAICWGLKEPIYGAAPLLPALDQVVPEELAALEQQLRQHPRAWIGFLVGLEGSAWIHLVLDGDPWPQEWSNKRQR